MAEPPSALWEQQEAGLIVDGLMEKLQDSPFDDEAPTRDQLCDPLWAALLEDMENHPPHNEDPQIDTRVDRIIERAPDLYQKFQQFVEAAFVAGPNGDGRPQHFEIPTSPRRPPPPAPG
jgi:hypothetical protein